MKGKYMEGDTELKFGEFNEGEIYKEDIELNELNYEVMVKKGKSDYIIVLPSSESYMDKFKFKRYEWNNELDDTLIYINDPTTKKYNIEVGWGQGSKDIFTIDSMVFLINSIIKKVNKSYREIIFFGTGASGFMSIQLASFFKNSVAIVDNPHYFLLNYYDRHVNNLIKNVYGGISKEEVLNIYGNRVDVLELFKDLNYVPKIIASYNILSEYYLKTQLEPFIKEIMKMNLNYDNRIEIYGYVYSKNMNLPYKEALNKINKYKKDCIVEKEVVILGSCVTRDIFNYGSEIKSNDYYARSTL